MGEKQDSKRLHILFNVVVAGGQNIFGRDIHFNGDSSE